MCMVVLGVMYGHGPYAFLVPEEPSRHRLLGTGVPGGPEMHAGAGH